MSDLKACPFCGRIPDIEYCGEHRWFIRCKCGIAQDKLFWQKCDAVRAWNKRKELRVKDTNVPITDTISREAAIDAVSEGLKSVFVEHTDIAKKMIGKVPSAQPTLYGYNIEHLKQIATVLQKENLPPERVAECLTDISRIVVIVKEEYEEALRKAVEQCKI